MSKIMIQVDGLRDRTPPKDCADCIQKKHGDGCWSGMLDELIVCSRIKVEVKDRHMTEEEDNERRYKIFNNNN